MLPERERKKDGKRSKNARAFLTYWERRSNSKRYRETSEGYGKGVQTWAQTGIVSICGNLPLQKYMMTNVILIMLWLLHSH